MTDKAISPLRRRMIEDMTIRRLSPKTHYQYIRHVKKLPISWAGLPTRPPPRMSVAISYGWPPSGARTITGLTILRFAGIGISHISLTRFSPGRHARYSSGAPL